MERVIIFSHQGDIDGLGSVVLSKLAFSNVDYVLAPNVKDLDIKFREYLESGNLNDYDRIFVTDLSLSTLLLNIISEDPNLSSKVLMFDHHKTAIEEGCDLYHFTTVIEEDDTGKKRCGTDLFYEYLCENGLLKRSDALDEFVELTRLEDSWEWKTNPIGDKAHDLAILFNALGIDSFIDKMYNKLLTSSTFEFDSDEIEEIKFDKRERRIKILENWRCHEVFVDENEFPFAALFADYESRNEIAEYARSFKSYYKYLVIVALEHGAHGQKSYRSIEPGFDVGSIAKSHGGGGHPETAAVNITENQKKKALSIKDRRERLKYLVESSYE